MPFSGGNFLYFLETEGRVLGRGQRSPSSGVDQIRPGFPRAGERSRLWSEVREGIQQGLPDGSPGIHHEAPPLRGKTQEICKVRTEFTSIPRDASQLICFDKVCPAGCRHTNQPPTHIKFA